MRYNGGKHACAREIATIIAGACGGALSYWEPFVGAANVITRPELSGLHRSGSDLDSVIISLLRHVRSGWEPPTVISEDEYLVAKNNPNALDAHMRAFIGYGCSFSGKYFGGYARSGVRNYAANASNSLRKQAPLLEGIVLAVGDYASMPFGRRDIIYCDPPYAGTTRCGASCSFDTDRFWGWCLERKREGSTVFVSGFSAPAYAQEVWRKTIRDGLRKVGAHQMTERLFKL